jgi:thymidylate synthase (FAD)
MNWQPGTDRHFLYKNTKMKVELLEIFGNDDMVANAARVSFGKEASNYSVEQNEKLIKYLAEHGHTSPFRHPQIQYRITCPIFVERQLFKHQVGLTANSISGRYVDFQDNYYKIEDYRIQSKSSKQGSAGHLERYDNDAALMIQDAVINYCATAYHELLQLGVAKEQARTILPLNLRNYFYLDRKFISLHKLLEVKNNTKYTSRNYANSDGYVM